MKFGNLIFGTVFFFSFIAFSCHNQVENKNEGSVLNEINQYELRKDFTVEDLTVIGISKDIIKSSYYCTLITIDEDGQPRARIMEPLEPDNNFEIWLATNPKSRKIKQIDNNSKATINYFNKADLSYISLMGNAFIVDDNEIKAQKWKQGWEKFYKNQKEDYILIRFIPQTLELISYSKGYSGDKRTWAPHKVELRD